MTQYERMLEGLPYHGDDEIREKMMHTRFLLQEYNQLSPDNMQRRAEIIRELFASTGKKFYIEQPFHCDYGAHIEIGENFYANYNLTVLDCNMVRIGDNVLFGPNVTLTAAGHPVHPVSRTKAWYEFGLPITIGDNVWLGANVVVCPGVTIGEGSVIGAGSVVTRDIPANVVAFGNPCRVYREITDEDKDYYVTGKKFDVEDY